MFAKKCDRCGKLYEMPTPELQKIKDKYAYGIAWEQHTAYPSIDLCPECTKSFKSWFEGGE